MKNLSLASRSVEPSTTCPSLRGRTSSSRSMGSALPLPRSARPGAFWAIAGATAWVIGFDVGRDPNRHLAFGFGVHLCLGAALARMETRAFFAHLLPRLESIELAGRPEWTATTFVGGLKHLPIRYSLKR